MLNHKPNQSDMPDKKFEMVLFLITEHTQGDVILTDSSYQFTDGLDSAILIKRGFIITPGYFKEGAHKGFFGLKKNCTFRKVPAHFWESVWGRPTNVI